MLISSPMLSYTSFSSSSTFYHSAYNSNSNSQGTRTTIVPIQFAPQIPTPIPVLLPVTTTASAATKIQAAYRSHLVRALLRRVLSVDSEASRFESLIRQQETVDAVRRDEKERLRVSEGLMALLLRLDSVPGFYPAVRNLRRSVSRRLAGLQDLLDLVVEESVVGLEGFPATLEEVVCGIRGNTS